MNRFIPKSVKWLTLLILVQAIPAIAADKKDIDCSVEPYDGKLFTQLYQDTQAVAWELCTGVLRDKLGQDPANDLHLGKALGDFAAAAEKSLDERQMQRSADYAVQFKAVRNTFAGISLKSDKLELPEFIVKSSLDGTVQGFFMPLKANLDRFNINEVPQCDTVAPGKSCKDVFRDFAKAFNPYRSAYNNIYDNQEQLNALGERWNRFLDAGKSQTALEVYLTTMMYRGELQKNHLVGPPDYQIIALHPHLIYDSMDKAPDGSQQEMGMAVEWFGVNFWDMKVPLGLSLASAYVDRPDVEDVGHGVMLHINNHYAIGWAKHKDDSSIYVTIDLLKMFEDKKQQYDRYMQN